MVPRVFFFFLVRFRRPECFSGGANGPLEEPKFNTRRRSYPRTQTLKQDGEGKIMVRGLEVVSRQYHRGTNITLIEPK